MKQNAYWYEMILQQKKKKYNPKVEYAVQTWAPYYAKDIKLLRKKGF